MNDILVFGEELNDWINNNESRTHSGRFSTYHRPVWDEQDEIIERKVKERFDEILAAKETFKFREVSKIEAKKEITSFILERHKESIFKISILDLILNLKLPASQVEGIMDSFVKKGKVKEL